MSRERHKGTNKPMKKIITGYWDNEPIWRYQTAAEQLLEELEQRHELKPVVAHEIRRLSREPQRSEY